MKSNSKFFEFVTENSLDDNFDNLKELCNTDFEKFCFDVITETKTFNINYDVEAEFKKDFAKYVPTEGKADTIYGEILRGLNKLCYRYLNDGDSMDVGPYSGIWFGLKDNFDLPFWQGDNSVQFANYQEWDNLEKCGYYFGWKDYIKNIAFATLIVKQFECYHGNNHVDISKYYDNILRFYISENIINLFAENAIDICNNMGFYCQPWNNVINSEDESLFLKINELEGKFELEINGYILNFTKDNISEYKDVIKKIFEIATYKRNKDILRDNEKLIEEINKLGYGIEKTNSYHIKGYIVK